MKQMISYLLICCFLLSSGLASSDKRIKTLKGDKIDPAEVDRFLKTQMDSLKIPGLSIAIINDAKVVYHRTLGVMNKNSMQKVYKQTVFEAGSLSKPIFAYYVMKLVEKGVLDLDTPLYKYLPYPDIEYDERYKQITARMVLCHSSGFPNWRNMNKDNKLDIKFNPGTGFLYSGEGYVYLVGTLAHLMKKDAKTMESHFQQVVSRPLEIEHACFVKNAYAEKHKASPHNSSGVIKNADSWWNENNFNPAGGLHTEAINYARFLIGVIEGNGLSKERLKEMLAEQVNVPKNIVEWTHFRYTGWGLGFALKPSPYGMCYCHTGNTLGFTSGFMINRDKKFGYVFFTNHDQANDFNPKLEAFLTNGQGVSK